MGLEYFGRGWGMWKKIQKLLSTSEVLQWNRNLRVGMNIMNIYEYLVSSGR